MYFERLPVRGPGNDVAVVCLLAFVQQDVKIRREMLRVPDLSICYHDDSNRCGVVFIV